jgi:hypothetical protein
MTGLDFFVWTLVVGYLVGRFRLHRHRQHRRRNQ